jgi:hypothetical protein
LSCERWVSRREIREACGWGNTQLKVHLGRLKDLEYLLIHRGGRGQSIFYELLYDGGLDDQKHLMGLIDPQNLGYDEKKSGVKGERSGSSRPKVGAKSATGRGNEIAAQPSADKASSEQGPLNGQNKDIKPEPPSSYCTRILETPAVPGA